MRILAAIPHYYSVEKTRSPDGRDHGSVGQRSDLRVAALSACIASLRQLYGHGPAHHRPGDPRGTARQCLHRRRARHCDLHDGRKPSARPAGATGRVLFSVTPRTAPLLSWALNATRYCGRGLGEYDYYVYIEDDLIARDPWFFVKLGWFTDQLGDHVLLQPNRYEVGPQLGLVHKAYIDGDLREDVTAPFQDVQEKPVATGSLLGTNVTFERAKNPHAGCFFLNARQMQNWAGQPYFLDRDTSFIGPLESAATLGIMRTFRVYKTAREHAGFLEIEHHGTGFLDNLRRRGDSGPAS